MLQDITSVDIDCEPHSSDYDRVRTAIAFISREWRRQPNLDEIAGEVGISASHLHAVFRRWSGL